jgi:hypothetical protein
MSQPIWQRKDIAVNEYRLLWWIIDVGGIGQVLKYGWVGKAANSLGLHRISVNRIVGRMIDKGLLIRPSKGNVMMNPEGFVSPLPDGFVRMKGVEDGKQD